MLLFVHIKTIDFVTHSCVLKKIFSFFAASYYTQVPSLKGPLCASKNLPESDEDSESVTRKPNRRISFILRPRDKFI